MEFAFWKGCAIGLSVAAPVGPIGVLCIRRSLAQGARIGFFTGLGAAAADGFYGAVAAFGLTAISAFLKRQEMPLRILGGLFLLYLGVKTFLSRPAREPAKPGHDAGAFASTFFLTLTNPMTIVSFLGIFTGFGFVASSDYFAASLLTAGVFAGSAAWWLALSHGTALLRSRVTSLWMQRVNQLSGLVILTFGAIILVNARNFLK